MSRKCRQAALIDQLVLGPVPPAKMSKLRAHLSECEGCRQRYNRIVLAERVLEGDEQELVLPSAAELLRSRAQVLERTRLAPDPPVRKSISALVLRFAGAMTAIGVVLAIAWPASKPLDPTPHPEFQQRGQAAKQGRLVGLRALCILKTAGKATVQEIPTDGKGSCSIDGLLKFIFSNRSELRQLFLVGLDERFVVQWYEPTPPARESTLTPTNIVDQPIKRTVRLKVNHKPGALRLYAIFSKKPVTAKQVQEAANALKASGRPITAIDLLPIEDSEQRSLLLHLTP